LVQQKLQHGQDDNYTQTWIQEEDLKRDPNLSKLLRAWKVKTEDHLYRLAHESTSINLDPLNHAMPHNKLTVQKSDAIQQKMERVQRQHTHLLGQDLLVDWDADLIRLGDASDSSDEEVESA
jgi:hypothetical protein